MLKKIYLFIIAAILLATSQGNCIDWKWFQGRLEQETVTYLMIPGVSLTAAQTIALDTNIKIIKYGSGITLSSITLNRSDVAGTAFISNPSVDLRPYVGFKITLNDTGTGAVGWIKAAGTGELLNNNTIVNGTAWTGASGVTPPTGWARYTAIGLFSNSGGYLTVAVDTTPSANPRIYQVQTTIIGATYRLSLSFQKETAATGFFVVGSTAKGYDYLNLLNLADVSWTTHIFNFVVKSTTTSIMIGAYSSTAGETALFNTVTLSQVLTPSATGVTIWDNTAQNWVTVGSTPNAASFVATITRN